MVCLVAFAVCLGAASGFAQQNGSDAAAATLRATHATGSIKLDGRLDDDAWGEAEMVVELVQQSPKPGVSSPYKTRVFAPVEKGSVLAGMECCHL